MAAKSRRNDQNGDLEFTNPVPVWRRSLTESGMRRKPTALDAVVVAAFLLAVAAMITWMLVR